MSKRPDQAFYKMKSKWPMKYLKECSISLEIRELQIKNPDKITKPSNRKNFKTLIKSNIGEDVTTGTHNTGSLNWYNHFGKCFGYI